MTGFFNILGYAVMGLGAVFMIFGVIGLFQPGKDFYYRLLVACKIDTVGMLTFAIGMAIRHGISFFTGKVLLIVIIVLVLNPLVAHIVGEAAQKSGYLSAFDREQERLQNEPGVSTHSEGEG